ncbi:FtsK/SpoIIIE domain-containing protein [Paucisalibacillus globulus]|uniref:FtsK/SpoIIIE domain-containing protein n=1 Tax=Paucisalibacillus globulus TaxID=351095 RepID=UPI000BB78A1E|nr:FtsK/SpoIIIE domain-containing protein [Paucisalibacillus globulus]
MLFELLSTASMAGIAGTSFYFKNKNAANDHEKIIKIADYAGLKTKEGSIRIYRKTKHKNHTEYVYKVPLGLSFQQFKDVEQKFIDGLNNKSRPDLNLANLKNIDWKGDVVKQLKDIIQNRVKLDKKIEMEFDGMLKIRVYEKGLEKLYLFDEKMLGKVRGWKVPIGFTYKDFILHDFEERPHMIVAGATGFGKSEFVKLLISVLVSNKPDQVRFHLIDLKGGAELGPFRDMKQAINFGRNVKEAKVVLEAIQEDMNNKLEYLFEKGFKDIKRAGQKERDFIVIDEAADLDDECKELVTDISRRGRAAGYRLIYTTQYPTNETLPSQVRANIGARVCFRLETGAQSRAVLDENGAEDIPEIEGRAIFRRVRNYIVQTPYMEEEMINKIIKPHIIKKEGLGATKDTRTPRANPFEFKES